MTFNGVFELMEMALYVAVNVICTYPWLLRLFRNRLPRNKVEELPSISENSEQSQRFKDDFESLTQKAILQDIPDDILNTEIESDSNDCLSKLMYDEFEVPVSYYDLSDGEDDHFHENYLNSYLNENEYDFDYEF
ncbi:unnamed protein product [Diamesa serratosioi]